MLRKRLYSGLLPLLTLLVVLNIFVILQIKNLDSTFEEIQMENYGSIMSLRNLGVEASRLGMAKVMADSGLERQGRLLAARATEAFQIELDVLRQSDHLLQEQEIIRDLLKTGEALLARFRPFVAGEVNRVEDERSAQDLSEQVVVHARALEDYNRMMLGERTRAFRSKIRLSNYVILATTGVAIIFALFFSNLLSRRIVSPIERLTQSTREIARGNWDMVVDQGAPDEIGVLARVMNDMILKLREYRRLTDRRILHSRRRMASFLDNAADAIFFVNARKQTTYKNPRAIKLFESLGWNEEGLPEELEKDIDQVLLENSAVISGDLGGALVVTVEDKKYAYLPLVTPLEADESGPEVAVVLQDVTKMRLANDLKSNLLATVSHEIKTPLTSARMSLYLVLDGGVGDLDEKQRDLLETTRGDLERLLTLLNNILDFARLEAGVSQLKFQATSPLPLVQRAHMEFRSAAAQQRKTLEFKCEDDLPDVSVDRTRIQVVLANFVSNALKLSPEGSVIMIYARKSGEGVRFGVIDRGPGVPKEAAYSIFERFYRAPGGAKHGAGLGLSISREIVVAHGGSIAYENNDDQVGSNFYFILPPSTT